MDGRQFNNDMKEGCWDKAKVVPNRDPNRWRYDAAGRAVCKQLTGCVGAACYEYDHIKPFSLGGETSVQNCQILATPCNRAKSNKLNPDLESLSCEIEFNDEEMDFIELAIYKQVNNKFGNEKDEDSGSSETKEIGMESRLEIEECDLCPAEAQLRDAMRKLRIDEGFRYDST